MFDRKREKTPNKIDQKPASQMEIDYAKKLGIKLPMNITQSDAKAIIACSLDDDEKASESLLSYARSKGMLCSDYIGNKALHNQLFDNLSKEDQIAFFCFCVYKFYWKDENEDLSQHPRMSLFEAFAKKYKEDGYFNDSLEEYTGEEIVTFGKSQKVINGVAKNIYGGSAHTRAHNEAYNYLKDNIH